MAAPERFADSHTAGAVHTGSWPPASRAAYWGEPAAAVTKPGGPFMIRSRTRLGRLGSFIPSVSDRERLTGWLQPLPPSALCHDALACFQVLLSHRRAHRWRACQTGVSDRIGHAVRRVVVDNKPLFAFQQRHEEMRKNRSWYGRKISPCVRPSGLHSSLYFWYRDELADFQDRRLRTRCTVAVDDKARIVLLHQGSVECVRDHAAERGDADVPGHVAHRTNGSRTQCRRPNGCPFSGLSEITHGQMRHASRCAPHEPRPPPG
jgi:hypothetical protein